MGNTQGDRSCGEKKGFAGIQEVLLIATIILSSSARRFMQQDAGGDDTVCLGTTQDATEK